MNHAAWTLATTFSLALTGAAVAEIDHGHSSDIEFEIESGTIHVHPEGYDLFANHDAYAFSVTGSTWLTTSPGWAGHDLGASRTFDLISVTPLYAFDGAQFVAAASDLFLRVKDPGSTEEIDLYGNMAGELTLLFGIGTTESDGELHSHGVFQLRKTGGGEPADGAYLAGFRAASSGLTSSDTFWILFHKGLDDAMYHDAVHEAEEQFGITGIPEPTSLALMAAAGGLLLRRRRA